MEGESKGMIKERGGGKGRDGGREGEIERGKYSMVVRKK